MSETRLIYPMFAMVLLTAVVLVVLFRGRVRAVREGTVNKHYFKIYQKGVEPPSSAKAARHFSNLFEAPTLFYAACLAAMIMHQSGPALQALAWLYVVARVVHAYVHLGHNRLGPRIRTYFFGWLTLLAMWTYLAASVLSENWHDSHWTASVIPAATSIGIVKSAC
jgi:hypothetical protein